MSYPLLDVFLTMLWFFLWVLWIYLLVMVIADIFKAGTSAAGARPAGWPSSSSFRSWASSGT